MNKSAQAFLLRDALHEIEIYFEFLEHHIENLKRLMYNIMSLTISV